MHYISHLFYLMQFTNEGNDPEHVYYVSLFHEIIKPVVYERLIPTTINFFTPVLNYMDVRFSESIAFASARASDFVCKHTGRYMNHNEFDVEHLRAGKDIVQTALKQVYENKYNDDAWKVGFISCLNKASIINADINVCEFAPAMEQNGMKCIKPFRNLVKLREKMENNQLSSDPDDIIDRLLDVYSTINNGLRSYNIPTEKEKVK